MWWLFKNQVCLNAQTFSTVRTKECLHANCETLLCIDAEVATNCVWRIPWYELHIITISMVIHWSNEYLCVYTHLQLHFPLTVDMLRLNRTKENNEKKNAAKLEPYYLESWSPCWSLVRKRFWINVCNWMRTLDRTWLFCVANEIIYKERE